LLFAMSSDEDRQYAVIVMHHLKDPGIMMLPPTSEYLTDV
jgi:hypothetical protein